MIEALKASAEGEIKKHLVNIDVYLHNPVGSGEHPNVMAAIQEQLDVIAEHSERLDVLTKHFGTWKEND